MSKSATQLLYGPVLVYLQSHIHICYPGPPKAAEKRNSMLRVVPHCVNGGAGLQPLLHRRRLPLAEPAVQVPAQVHRDLRVQHWKKAPGHCEEAAGVLDGVAGEAAHVTEVELWPATGQLAQRLLHRIAVIEIVVKPHSPT